MTTDTQPRTAIFEYRCRRCGGVFGESPSGRTVDTARTMLHATHFSAQKDGPVHDCPDGGAGLSDLIGYRVE